MISIIYHKYGKSVNVEIILLFSVLCYENTLILFSNLNSEVFINPFQSSVTFLYPLKMSENQRFFIFEKDLLLTINQAFRLNRSKFLRVATQRSLLFSLIFYACVLLSNANKKVLRKLYFSCIGISYENKTKTNQKKDTVFRHCCL